jgi:hypothetical protein
MDITRRFSVLFIFGNGSVEVVRSRLAIKVSESMKRRSSDRSCGSGAHKPRAFIRTTFYAIMPHETNFDVYVPTGGVVTFGSTKRRLVLFGTGFVTPLPNELGVSYDSCAVRLCLVAGRCGLVSLAKLTTLYADIIHASLLTTSW